MIVITIIRIIFKYLAWQVGGCCCYGKICRHVAEQVCVVVGGCVCVCIEDLNFVCLTFCFVYYVLCFVLLCIIYTLPICIEFNIYVWKVASTRIVKENSS